MENVTIDCYMLNEWAHSSSQCPDEVTTVFDFCSDIQSDQTRQKMYKFTSYFCKKKSAFFEGTFKAEKHQTHQKFRHIFSTKIYQFSDPKISEANSLLLKNYSGLQLQYFWDTLYLGELFDFIGFQRTPQSNIFNLIIRDAVLNRLIHNVSFESTCGANND